MYVVAIHHAVQDFEKWKRVYDTHPPTVGWGGAFARVHRSVDDPKLVTVLAGFNSLDALKTMVLSPELKNGMLRQECSASHGSRSMKKSKSSTRRATRS